MMLSEDSGDDVSTVVGLCGGFEVFEALLEAEFSAFLLETEEVPDYW